MGSSKAFRVSLVVGLLLVGAWLYSGPTDNLAVSGTPVSARGVLKNISLADYLSSLINKSVYFLKTTGQSKDLLFYGALALVGIVIMIIAITSAARPHKDPTDTALEALKHEKEKAENLARLKSEFLNQVSHELRTPLAVIIGYVECLTDGLYGQIDMKHHDILQVVAKQSSHLKNMIDQILIFSRLEADRQPVRVGEFSIHNIIADLKETFEFLCRQKGLTLNWHVPEYLGTMKNDGERVKEVLSNLLQNAVKYTDQGSISVTVQELRSTDSVLLQVADTGIGIPENYLPVIFEPFRQVHKTSTENSRGGIGLGLAIVKKHVEQMRGTITVESELGKGSMFKIILPRAYEKSALRHKKLFRLLNLVRQSDDTQEIKANGASKIQGAGRATEAPWLS
jgi:signal transduction histidine kinase